MNEKATIYDYARLCGTVITCDNCPMRAARNGTNLSCDVLLIKNPDKANEIIIKWCEEHPEKTRQDRFLKMFPNAKPLLYICPSAMGYKVECPNDCDKCRRDYWLAEVDE